MERLPMTPVWLNGKIVGKVYDDWDARQVADNFYARFGDLDVYRDPDGWILEYAYGYSKHTRATVR